MSSQQTIEFHRDFCATYLIGGDTDGAFDRLTKEQQELISNFVMSDEYHSAKLPVADALREFAAERS